MEEIDNVFNVFKQLRNCSSIEEVKELQKSLKRSGIRSTKRRRTSNTGRDLNNLIKNVEDEIESVESANNRTTIVDEETQVEFLVRNLVGENFQRYKDEISHLLNNNKASRIGVWGMGGVGKTILVRHLFNMMLTRHDIYGYVYWITVPKDCNIHELQTEIAKRIGVSIPEKVDESQRAGILKKALKRKKNFVFVLDNMWPYYDLNDVGLGLPEETGYRLIVTSRLKNVCLNMCGGSIIKVKPLSQEDARTLFIKRIPHEIPDNLTKISNDVLQECAGLPLGIVTLAKSMIGCMEMHEWRNVLDKLRDPSGRVDDMEEEVFKVLRLSYEQLKDDEVKKCLLYCATYPEDHRIEMNELIWLFIDAGLVEKNVGLAKMFDAGLAILSKLELAALISIEGHVPLLSFEGDTLLFEDENIVVLLHDLIRDMALKIAGSRFMIKSGSGLEGAPDEKSWTNDLEVVSLVGNEKEEISYFSPRCTILSILLLQRNSFGCVSDGFFRYLHGLKHLDLSWSRITTFPASISQLKNLTSLILGHCYELIKLPSLAKLTSLERLDLWRTSISQLPGGIEKLIKLRYLNLYYTRIERIGVGVISKLTALQYLAITATFDVEELKSLNTLEHLTILFTDLDRFSRFSTQMKIKGRPNSYNFIFGVDRCGNKDYMKNGLSEEKQIFLKKPFLEEEQNSQTCKKRTLKLKESQEVLQDINKLCIEDDGDLMSLGDFVLDSALNLPRQSEKLKGPKPFFKLETLILKKCSNMKKVFPLGLLTNLQNIKAIRIWCCKGLEALIEEADDETMVGGTEHPQNFSFPKLKQLHLNDLPNLDNLCSNDKVIYTPSLQWISIMGCPKLKRMPLFDGDNQHQQFPEMDYAKDEEEWLQSLQWDPPESKTKITFVPL